MRAFFCVFISFVTLSCSYNPIREPAKNDAYQYDSATITLLTKAVQNGVLFQISDAVLRDVPSRSVGDQCRTSEELIWADNLIMALRAIDQVPNGFQRMHIIEMKRGDQVGVEVQKDLDGGVTLQIQYIKVENRATVETLDQIPCAQSDMELVGKELIRVRYEWPTANQITQKVTELEARPEISRFQIDKRFSLWLASKATIFRLTPELSFEKTPDGNPLLPYAMQTLSNEIVKTPHPKALEYWLHEISNRSKASSKIRFFGLFRDQTLSRGLQVDSIGAFSRKMYGYVDPTYPYLSYKVDHSQYQISTIESLNQCLHELQSTYRSPVASMSSFDLDASSFLFPGYHCQDN